MSRRPLPGADELFRPTAPALAREAGSGQGVLDGFESLTPPLGASSSGVENGSTAGTSGTPGPRTGQVDTSIKKRPARRRAKALAVKVTSGRERHDEKITVYVSQAELLDLERARLTLRGEHGVAVDRGRIVREALASALRDLESRGEDSTLVRRLSGA